MTVPSLGVTEMRPPVLRSKLRPPVSMFDLVERTRLVDRLVESDAPIWVITAPAGYGKTTLVVRSLERLGSPVAWVSVDAADDTPVRFWSHVAAALADLGVATDASVRALLDGHVDLAVDELVAGVESAGPVSVASGGVVLVLDDAHELADARITGGVERLLTNPPAGLRLVLTARHDLDLGLARRRLAGDVVDVTGDDLAFTIAEGRRALEPELDAGVLDAASADRLIEQIEGWPAGVRLAQLALRGRHGSDGRDVLASVGGASPEVAGYLAAEVVSGLDDDDREFLLDTSILGDLMPGVCDAVTGRTDSLGVLRRLATEQVFTSLVDPQTSTFRTHRLFREFLLAELDAQPEARRRELHRRAMRWYLRSDSLDHVVWHAVSAGEFGVAQEAVADRLLSASNRGQIDDMWRWIEWIGTERVLADRSLAALPAWVSLNQRRYDEIDPWLDAIVMVDDLDADQRRDFEVHAATIRAGRDRHLGALDTALEHGAEALELLARSTDEVIVPTVHATTAQLLALTGDPSAGQMARHAIDLAATAGQEPPLVMAYAALALASDEPDAAAAAADSALSFVTGPDLERFHRPAIAWYARAWAAFESGRVGDAEESAGRAIAIATAGDEPTVVALAEALRARVSHLLGRDDERRAALRAADGTLAGLSGAEWIAQHVHRAHTSTRFAPGAADDRLPIGARELTERELAVLRLLPHGLPRRELAKQLFVSENTVKTHLLSIRRKLGLSGRSDIVERARELGLVTD